MDRRGSKQHIQTDEPKGQASRNGVVDPEEHAADRTNMMVGLRHSQISMAVGVSMTGFCAVRVSATSHRLGSALSWMLKHSDDAVRRRKRLQLSSAAARAVVERVVAHAARCDAMLDPVLWQYIY
eukprot:SAG31_NODE_6753_length_1898_cov_1.431907_2_plen_125_part_00